MESGPARDPADSVLLSALGGGVLSGDGQRAREEISAVCAALCGGSVAGIFREPWGFLFPVPVLAAPAYPVLVFAVPKFAVPAFPVLVFAVPKLAALAFPVPAFPIPQFASLAFPVSKFVAPAFPIPILSLPPSLFSPCFLFPAFL